MLLLCIGVTNDLLLSDKVALKFPPWQTTNTPLDWTVVTRKEIDSNRLLFPDTPNQQYQQRRADASQQPVNSLPNLKNIMEETNKNKPANCFYATANLTEPSGTGTSSDTAMQKIRITQPKWLKIIIIIFLRKTVSQKVAASSTCWIKQSHLKGRPQQHCDF